MWIVCFQFAFSSLVRSKSEMNVWYFSSLAEFLGPFRDIVDLTSKTSHWRDGSQQASSNTIRIEKSVEDTPFLKVLGSSPHPPPPPCFYPPPDLPLNSFFCFLFSLSEISYWFISFTYFYIPPSLRHEDAVHGALLAQYKWTVITVIIIIIFFFCVRGWSRLKW